MLNEEGCSLYSGNAMYSTSGVGFDIVAHNGSDARELYAFFVEL